MTTDISSPGLTEASKVLYSAIKEYAASRHVYDIGAGDMDRMLSAALSKVSTLGPAALANLSSSGATVLDAVQSGFAQVYGTPSETQRQAQLEQRAAANAAGTGALADGFPGTLARGGRALAMQDDGGQGGRSERVSSASYKERLGGDASGLAYAKQLGIDPAYAGFFSGGSPEVRNALRDALRNGTPIGEEKIKSMGDVQTVVGAIRAGKLKPDDPRIPDSVKKVIADMKGKGIDPATSNTKLIRKYFKENPNALKDVRRAADSDLAARSAASRQSIEDESKRIEAKRGATADPAKPGTKETKLGNPPAAKAHKASSTL
ncbi:MAG: hypothetical protein QOF14_728 [Hyphomicrobiales bacterium]|jgi:hypothetical protein|nr:hypothetical protein [Hyphomicrobiales bacterium]